MLGTVVAHQGGVEVYTSSRGSRFTVYIPQLPAVERTDANPITVEPIMRETCLVVDDHAEVLTFDEVQRAFDAVPTPPAGAPDVDESSPG